MQAMVRIVNSGVYFATLMTALSACSEAAQSVAQPDAAVDPKKDAQGSPTSCDFEISDNEGLAGPAMEMRQRLDLHLRSVDGNACLKMARVAKCRETICKQWDFDVLRTVMVAGGTRVDFVGNASIEWTISQHNWYDKARIASGGHVFTIADDSFWDAQGKVERWQLTQLNANGEPVGAAVALFGARPGM